MFIKLLLWARHCFNHYMYYLNFKPILKMEKLGMEIFNNLPEDMQPVKGKAGISIQAV